MPVNNIEENYKKYHEIYINYLQQGNSTMADSIDLKSIAEKCPFSDGSVIYQARALYNTIFKTYQIFENNCLADIEAKSMFVENETETPSGWMLFPNPAQNEVNIAFEDRALTQIDIQVMDINGKIVFTNSALEILEGISTFRLDVENGMYVVKLTNSITNETTIHKLAIQK